MRVEKPHLAGIGRIGNIEHSHAGLVVSLVDAVAARHQIVVDPTTGMFIRRRHKRRGEVFDVRNIRCGKRHESVQLVKFIVEENEPLVLTDPTLVAIPVGRVGQGGQSGHQRFTGHVDNSQSATFSEAERNFLSGVGRSR